MINDINYDNTNGDCDGDEDPVNKLKMKTYCNSPVRRPTERMSWFMVAATDANTSPRQHKRPPKKDTFREVNRRHRHPLTGAAGDKGGMNYRLQIPSRYWPISQWSVLCSGM